MAEYTLGKCKVRTFEPPPKSFDPFAATAPQLLHHGFPRRPDPVTEAEASLQWVRAMRKYRDLNFTYVVPEFKELPRHVHGLSKRVKKERRGLVNDLSYNWSGSVVFTDPATDPFTRISGLWTVPNAYSPNSGTWTYYADAMIGIDGDGSTDVLAGGTETSVSGSDRATSLAWWEWLTGGRVAIDNCSFAPGDVAQLLICCETNKAGGVYGAAFYWGNFTSRQFTSFSTSSPPGVTLVGNCAEAVLARPMGGPHGLSFRGTGRTSSKGQHGSGQAQVA